jgi:hypothetical protein
MYRTPGVRRVWNTTPVETDPNKGTAWYTGLSDRMHLLERMAAVESAVLTRQRAALLRKQRESKEGQLAKQAAKRVSWDLPHKAATSFDNKPQQAEPSRDKERSEHSQKVQVVKKDHLDRQAPLEVDFIEQPLDELLEDEPDAVDQVLEALHEDVLGDILHACTVNPGWGKQGLDVLQEDEEDPADAI